VKLQSSIILPKLKEYVALQRIRFDVPGHKGINFATGFANNFGKKIEEYDVNATPGLDNLCHPTEMIYDAHCAMAQLFKASHARFLINGTTIGIQAMLLATLKESDKVLVPTNIHKSIYNGLILSGAKPVYYAPNFNEEFQIDEGANVELIKDMIIKEKPKAIVLINPNYYGFVSDLNEIIKFAKLQNVITLVDEAHGGHFSFSEELPSSAVSLGADIVCVSTHKILGSLTQTSVLFHNFGLVKISAVDDALNILQTTSPSYIFMSSLDEMRVKLNISGHKIITEKIKLVKAASTKINSITGLKCYITNNNHDLFKLVINVNGIGFSGFKFYDLMREHYNIQFELADNCNVLAIIGVGDSKKNIDKLISALTLFVEDNRKTAITLLNLKSSINRINATPRQIFMSNDEEINYLEAHDKIAKSAVNIYPPGIAIINPGEKITVSHIDEITRLLTNKIDI